MSQAPVVKKLPCFADLPPEAKTVEAIQAAFRDPPVVRIELADLEEERRHLRGVYETSWPTIDGERAVARGRIHSAWLTRQPDWRKAGLIARWRPFFLYEATPVPINAEQLLNYRWRIEVVGEEEQRFAEEDQFAMRRRFRVAG